LKKITDCREQDNEKKPNKDEIHANPASTGIRI